MRNIFTDGVVLNTNDWYLRLLYWMWKVEPTYFKSLCPLFWCVVGSIVVLPMYAVIRFISGKMFDLYKTKHGKKILDTVGIIGKWFILIMTTFLLTFVVCACVSGFVLMVFYRVFDTLGLVAVITLVGIIMFSSIILFISWYFDRKEKKIERMRREGIMPPVKRVKEKKLKMTRTHRNPFRMFGSFISATYHRVCPMIIWTD